MSERDILVYKAKLAEQAERYEDMKEVMKQVATGWKDLSVEERNLLSVAFKNVVGARRSSWRVLSSSESKYREQSDAKNDEKISRISSFREKVESELKEICGEILHMLGDLIKTTEEELKQAEGEENQLREAKVFYQKMQGDYYRYMAEFVKEDENKDVTEKAREAYKDAWACAAQIPPTNAIRLGLALNYSVFHYEIRNSRKEACELAKSAFEDAVSELDSLKEDSYKDSTLIMQLLRDNLLLWNTDSQDEDDTQVQDIENEGS